MRKIFVLVICCFFTKLKGQSLEINPGGNSGFVVSKNSSNPNKTLLEGELSALLEISAKKVVSDFGNHGEANITLRSEFNGSALGLKKSGISFFDSNTKRWFIGDIENYDSFPSKNDFVIEDNNTVALRISKFDNQTVFVKQLGIMNLDDPQLEGKTLSILPGGRIGPSPNEVIVVGLYDLVSADDTVFVRSLSGSYIPNNSNKSLYAPLHLPHGKALEQLTVTYRDNSTTDGISIALVETAGTSESFIAQVTSANENSASTITKSPSFFTTTTFDNKTKQYYLKITPRNQATTGSGRWRSSNIRFVKATIEVK